MNYRTFCKKPVLFGLAIILFVVCKVIFDLGWSYPQLAAVEEADGIKSFSMARFEDIAAVVPYDAFDADTRFTTDRRPGFSVRWAWQELEKDNIAAVISQALDQSKPVTGGAISERHFQHGVYRHLPGVGEEYRLVFRKGADVFSTKVYKKVGEPIVSVSRHEDLRSQPLHVVTPLSGRHDRLLAFLEMLAGFIDAGENVYLTVVAFTDGRENGTRPAAEALRRWRHASRAQLVSEAGAFSRGRALTLGAAAAAPGRPAADPLLFFCDVDMTFTAAELEKCRLHAERGRSVYYPIVFSRYNERLAAALEQATRWPAGETVTSDNGDWRHYGFGMSCQYRSDFSAVSGAYLHISGWGGEDVALYLRLLSRLHVVRAVDPDLVHEYHGKECSDRLPHGQYRSCVFSKIENEGNKHQLGILALSHAGELGPRAYRLFHLPWYRRPDGWALLCVSVLLALSLALNVRLLRRRATR